MTMHVTSAQMRAARGLLNWSVRELSEHAGVHRNTITNFETGKSGGDPETLQRLAGALEKAGVIFVDENGEGPGVRLRKARPVDEGAAVDELNASNDGWGVSMDWMLSSLLFEQPTFRQDLLNLIAERAARPELARHLFEYNIHDVTVDFEAGDVLIDSVIHPEELRMTLSELLEALGLPRSWDGGPRRRERMIEAPVSFGLEEIEQDRLDRLAAAAEDRESTPEELIADFAPFTFGCHEALHTASIVMNLVDERLCEHPAILANPD